MKEFIQSMKRRYATKAFDPSKKLSQAQIDELMEIANLSASSYGLQPYRIVLVQSGELREKLLEFSYGQRQIVDASTLLVICSMKQVPAEYVEAYVQNISKTRGVAIGELEVMKNTMLSTLSSRTAEQIAAWTRDQSYILLGTLLAGCAMMEIDSTPMEGFIPDEYDRILGLSELGLRANLLLPIGYHSDSDYNFGAPKVRNSMSELVIIK